MYSFTATFCLNNFVKRLNTRLNVLVKCLHTRLLCASCVGFIKIVLDDLLILVLILSYQKTEKSLDVSEQTKVIYT